MESAQNVLEIKKHEGQLVKYGMYIQVMQQGHLLCDPHVMYVYICMCVQYMLYACVYVCVWVCVWVCGCVCTYVQYVLHFLSYNMYSTTYT